MLAVILWAVGPWNGLKNTPYPPGSKTLANVSEDKPSLNGPETLLVADAIQPTGVARVWPETAIASRLPLDRETAALATLVPKAARPIVANKASCCFIVLSGCVSK